MTIGIGIDTGGTYTDTVIYDFDKKEVLAKGKTLTTRENLETGIGNALDMLPHELAKQAAVLSLSTTLATNACVENKGGRAKAILIGTSDKVLRSIDAETVYGLRPEDVLCLDVYSSLDGRIVNHPDWDLVMEEYDEWFRDAQALSVSAVNAVRNGAVCEKLAKERLTAKYHVPFVMAYELASELNVMERGAPAGEGRWEKSVSGLKPIQKQALRKKEIPSIWEPRSSAEPQAGYKRLPVSTSSAILRISASIVAFSAVMVCRLYLCASASVCLPMQAAVTEE